MSVMDRLRYDGKRALVVGGATGMGAAAAKSAAELGAEVIVMDYAPVNYDVAKAMDEQQGLLQWALLNFSYNRHTVWKCFGVPLHPGAERYYREVGYMK